MNKLEIIDHIAKSADISKAAAGRSLDAAVTAIKTAMKKGSMVTLVGFGTFYVGRRAARTGRDRKSTRLSSSHGSISYAVFCLKKKNPDLLAATAHTSRSKRSRVGRR